MKAKFINEITRAEDDWANAQIDQWQESHRSSESDLNSYNDQIVNYIWKRLRTKLSPEFLKRAAITKRLIYRLINTVDEPGSFYMSVSDYWEENTPWDEAANLLFDEVYRGISLYGQNM